MDSNSPEIKIEHKSKALLWLENYWYHYKWRTIVVLFFLIVIVISTVQCATKNTNDLIVYYVGNKSLTQEQQQGIAQVLNQLNEEIGSKYSVGFSSMSIYSPEELTKENVVYDSETESHVDHYAYTMQKNTNDQNMETLTNSILTGEYAVWFVSPYVFETFNLLEKPLSDVFGETLPSGAVQDEKSVYTAVRLGSLDVYQKYTALRVMPAETLVILSEKVVIGKVSKAEYYQAFTDLYKKITLH